MTHRRKGRLGGAGLAGLLFGWLHLLGCAHAPPPTRPYPPPLAETLLAGLRSHQAAVTSASARVRATSWLGGERVRATVNMLIERDGHLRFEAEVSLQGMVAALATDGTTFALYDARKQELSRGPACPANVASLVRIPLAPADVAAVLLGDARLPAAAAIDASTAVGWDPSRGADTLVLRDPAGGYLYLYFHGQDAQGARDLVAAVHTGRDGARLWQTAYEDFETVGGVRLPKLIKFAEGNGSFDDGVEIHFKDRTVNAPAPPNAFTLAPPAGAIVRDVGCPPAAP
jgi:outer membrane lipoprotein-sorting protein